MPKPPNTRPPNDVAARASPRDGIALDRVRLARMQRALLDWFRAEGSDLPWRRTQDPYAILVSEIMLQQTQRERVAPKFVAFLERFPTLDALAAAPTSAVI